MKSIIGKKIGMTSIFDVSGKQTAVTIIEAGPCVVTQKKTVETDGYNALQIAFGDKKEKHSIKAEINHFAKAQTSPKRFVQEIRDSEIDKNVGETITVDIFAEGDDVEVVGTTKGKGFQGCVTPRWSWGATARRATEPPTGGRRLVRPSSPTVRVIPRRSGSRRATCSGWPPGAVPAALAATTWGASSRGRPRT